VRGENRSTEAVVLGAALSLLAVGGLLYVTGSHDAANVVWATTTAGGLVAAAWWVVAAARHKRLGVDILAVLALIGTLIIGEYFAGAVITMMLATGRALEARATARARHELRALLERAPERRTATPLVN
jgi:cation transport ATPase